MARACKTCESTDFEIENCERVCTTCGEVQEELPGDQGDLRMLSDHQTVLDNIGSKEFDQGDRLNNRVRGEGQSAETKRNIGKAKTLDGMKRIVKQMVKEPSAVDETMDLMKSTFHAYHKRMLTPKKNGLAGACIYYLSAKHQLGISINDICKTLDIKMKVINICLKEVKRLCPDFEYERPNIKDLVRKFVDQMAMRNFDTISGTVDTAGCSSGNAWATATDPPQPLIDKKDKVVLQNRVMLLLDLFEAMHPYKQPSPQSLITAVIYHAWKSLDTFKAIALNLKRKIHDLERSSSPGGALVVADPELEAEELKNAKDMAAKHSISYRKFCELSDLRYSSNGHNIVSKLQSSLLALGRHIGDVNKINLPWYLEDIIDNSHHLLQEHKRNGPTREDETLQAVDDKPND